MESVKMMIHNDGRRQLWTGSLLLVGSLVFISGLFTMSFLAIYAMFMTVFLMLSGISLVVTGYRDLQKSKNTEMGFFNDKSFEGLAYVPQRMYIGSKTLSRFHMKLYDMSGESYGEMIEESLDKNKPLRAMESLSAFGVMRSAEFKMKDESGDLCYTVEKKGGFTWKGYVKNPEDRFVAYTNEIKSKKKGHKHFQYIEKNQHRWHAEGDSFIGHFTVTDGEGTKWAMIKKGAIPTEAADIFERMPGMLVEWKQREQIPYSLIVFLFLIQTRDNM